MVCSVVAVEGQAAVKWCRWNVGWAVAGGAEVVCGVLLKLFLQQTCAVRTAVCCQGQLGGQRCYFQLGGWHYNLVLWGGQRQETRERRCGGVCLALEAHLGVGEGQGWSLRRVGRVVALRVEGSGLRPADLRD